MDDFFRITKLFCYLYQDCRSSKLNLKKEDSFFFELIFQENFSEEVFEKVAKTVDALEPKNSSQLELAMLFAMANYLGFQLLGSKSSSLKALSKKAFQLAREAILVYERRKCV